MLSRVIFSGLFVFFLGASTGVTAQSADVLTQIEGEEYVVEGVKVHKYLSEIVPNQTYEISVNVPGSYYSSPDKDYPLIVVLDGQWNFTLAKDVVGKLSYDGMIPEVIVASVTWGGEGDDPNQLRTRDFVRPQVPYFPLSGGAELFLNALTEELVPFVESLYRAGGKKVLIGASLGGLFTSYAMVEKPEYFDGYLAIAGSYFIDQPYLEEKLDALQGTYALKGTRSFMAVGALDGNTAVVEALSDSVKSKTFKGFKNKTKVYNGLGHAGVEPVAYVHGLQYIFKRPFRKISEEFLQQYAGTYEGGPDGQPAFPISVTVAGRGLITIGDDFQQNELRAQSKTEFYINGANVTAEFLDDGSLVINSQGTLLKFYKITE